LRATLGDGYRTAPRRARATQPIEAAQLAKSLEPYRLFYLEDPLMPEHRESWPVLRAASTTPLAIGEIFSGRWDCLPLFMNRWIDFIRSSRSMSAASPRRARY
jgi:mannonate dehydratase